MDEDSILPPRMASSPCLACEVAPGHFDPLAVDPQQALDVARWRKAERGRLRAERQALSVAAREGLSRQLSDHLARFLGPIIDGKVFSGYWPIKGELDLRPLMTDLHRAGITVALPVVEVKAAPLVFRRWTPEMRMVRGDWNIPVPPPEADAVDPDIALAPVMGWTKDGYRLGYGGGYFDRTLAARHPMAIGIGLQAAELATIFPQPHDIPLDAIMTENGLQMRHA